MNLSGVHKRLVIDLVEEELASFALTNAITLENQCRRKLLSEALELLKKDFREEEL